jgi:VIT1/CCC1 family predicted Fe2+/Mn2+ transporter
MVLMAGFGPVTSAVEALAVSVGAGILLGGFCVGALATLRGWEPRHRDEQAVGMGYIAGLVMASVAFLETIVR